MKKDKDAFIVYAKFFHNADPVNFNEPRKLDRIQYLKSPQLQGVSEDKWASESPEDAHIFSRWCRAEAAMKKLEEMLKKNGFKWQFGRTFAMAGIGEKIGEGKFDLTDHGY